MTNLERLDEEKRKMIERHRRERQVLEDKIAKEKERIRRQKEREKKQKEQQQNTTNGAFNAYQSYVKDSMSIAEINAMLEDLLNQEQE